MSNFREMRFEFLKFESLAASDRLVAFGKITTAAKHFQDIKLGPNARVS